MKYSELFHSIQGEGTLVGVPSVFFRTSFCNLRCIWCDTPYTSWEPEDRDIAVEEAFERIASYGCRHVVITGGEPFIQARELAGLCGLLDEGGYHTTVETNATVFAPVRAQLISMSPKLANSNPTSDRRALAMHEPHRYAPDVIRAFAARHACQVKFVVCEPSDMDEIDAIVRECELAPSSVVLMPEGRTPDETRTRTAWLAEACVERGYRLSPRLHIDIWGTKRGV
ncbi:7-carboxy-7-deazaguanine synthase QueE [Candidatus Poribacteria bacterium]|nr:7-carboxy-7-deazaguanine synthase QueE [Candidatus Poribacteria bacterium]